MGRRISRLGEGAPLARSCSVAVEYRKARTRRSRCRLDILESSVGYEYFRGGCDRTRRVSAEPVNLIFLSETVTFVI